MGGGDDSDSVAQKQLALQQQQIRQGNEKIQQERLSSLKRMLGDPTADTSIAPLPPDPEPALPFGPFRVRPNATPFGSLNSQASSAQNNRMANIFNRLSIR